MVTLRVITDITPIENADAVELAHIDGWPVVVRKNEYEKNEVVSFFEIDSYIPRKPEFEFLFQDARRQFITLKTKKIRGQLSQGLILKADKSLLETFQVGDDVSEFYGVVKYEPPLTGNQNQPKGNFPSFIIKTDEERIQNHPEYRNKYNELLKKISKQLIGTEKLNGSSMTVYSMLDGTYGVTSHNVDLKESDNNIMWQVAKQDEVINKLNDLLSTMITYFPHEKGLLGLAIQGELVGPGIQGNDYKLMKQEFHPFYIQYIAKAGNGYLSMLDGLNYDAIKQLFPNVVPIVYELDEMPDTETLLKLAEGKSALNKDVEREGIVFEITHEGVRNSFKVISNTHLLGQK